MINIEDIKNSIKTGKIRITEHADEEAQADSLLLGEILDSVADGEIIKQYSHDKPYPSCLIFGENSKGEPIHSVWAYNKETEASILITVYRPDPLKWIDGWKTRRKL